VTLPLRDDHGLPDPNIAPPVIAETRDPFAGLRVAHLVARLPRGAPIRLRDIVDRLNRDYVDWSFSRPVVADVIVQLQANWMADYRVRQGIQLVDGPAGEEVILEDSARIERWLDGQVERLAAECRDRLRAFARDEGATP
jgi:phage-related baseplate assembly protein